MTERERESKKVEGKGCEERRNEKSDKEGGKELREMIQINTKPAKPIIR